MALRTEQKLPIILAVVFITLTVIGVLFYQSTSSLQQAIVWERETKEFIFAVEDVMTQSLDTEVGVRKFILTGNDTYLEAHKRAKLLIPRDIAKLKSHPANVQASVEEIAVLESLMNDFFADQQKRIDERKINGPESAPELLSSSDDQTRMEQVRRTIQRLKDLENDSLQIRESSIDNGLYRTVWVLIISSVVGVFGLALANLVVYREITRRRTAETALVDVNRGLEEKIDQRTIELTEMNDRLMKIGAERELALLSEKSARREAEIANRLRDEFMASVSHELRTPLNSILGWARLMKDGTLSQDQAERAISTIIKNSETQNRLIEDLLDVARLISGKLELARERVDVSGAMRDSIESARPVADSKSILFELNVDSSAENAFVIGDNERLHQVFANLLTNAIKFSHDHGKIDVGITTDGDDLLVAVKDEGIGISGDFLPLVFERFRQDNTSPGRNGGLGLGLAIVRNLVELHGGSVKAESEGENRGSTFRVRLPLDLS